MAGIGHRRSFSSSASPLFSCSSGSPGSADLLLDTIDIGGSDAGEFTRQNDLCSGGLLPPLFSCSFDVGFRPQANGDKRAVLAIPSSDPVRPRVDIQLTGNWLSSCGTSRRGAWYLDNGNGRWDPGIDIVHVSFGAPDDIPLAGVWR